jgi:hypothetical protein
MSLRRELSPSFKPRQQYRVFCESVRASNAQRISRGSRVGIGQLHDQVEKQRSISIDRISKQQLASQDANNRSFSEARGMQKSRFAVIRIHNLLAHDII